MADIVVVHTPSNVTQLLAERITQKLDLSVVVVESVSEAKRFISDQESPVLLTIVDLSLSPNNYNPFGELPTIIITGALMVQSNLLIRTKGVLDYVVNLESHNIQYIIQLIKRKKYASALKIMIVDDEVVARRLIKNILANKGIQVLEAGSGKEALSLLSEHPDIKLVVIDYHMPQMNGFELTQKIRANYSRNELAIIGYSGVDSRDLPATFMMHGANDFIAKPFSLEEFQIRVMQNIQIVENFQELREVSNRDFLTNLYNRRYFFEIGQKFFESAKRGHIDILVAMIDIDHFKKVNDTYGHAMGDVVLMELAKILKKNLRNSDIIARFGGEEFCILSTGVLPKDGCTVFNRIREAVENHRIQTPDGELQFTMSVGLSGHQGESLTDVVNKADALLYQAKNTGRNQVICEL
ncbi:MAG: diguanylate cyclase [Fibrobacterales bacterium]